MTALKNKKRVAVIGAGPSGLVTLKELVEAGHEVECFETRQSIGGLFNDGSEELQLTTSNITTAFGSFYRDCDRERGPVIWSGSEYLDYLKDFAENFDLLRRIHFATRVVSLEQDSDGSGWILQADPVGQDGDSPAICGEEQHFDHIAICSGANASPVVPKWKGTMEFEGRIVHSTELSGIDELAGKRVLLVGLGETGSDVSLSAAKVAQALALSTRSGPGYIIPRLYRGRPSDLDTNRCYHSLARRFGGSRIVRLKTGIENALLGEHDDRAVLRKANQINRDRGLSPFHRFGTKNTSFIEAMHYHGASYKPDIDRFDRDRAVFVDGSEFQCDIVVCCTGYRILVPCSSSWKPLSEAPPKPRGLFKRMIDPRFGASLVWIGLVRPGIGAVPPCAEMQARYFAQLVSGSIPLPSVDEMNRDVAYHARLDLEQFPDDASRLLTLTDYLRFLDSLAGVMGCRPQLRRTLLRDPLTGLKLLLAPLNGAQYRLVGPKAEPERARAFLRSLPTMPWPVLGYELLLLSLFELFGLNRDRWSNKGGGILAGSTRKL